MRVVQPYVDSLGSALMVLRLASVDNMMFFSFQLLRGIAAAHEELLSIFSSLHGW